LGTSLIQELRCGDPAIELKSLPAKIGELTLKNDFLERALGKVALLRWAWTTWRR